MADTITTLIDSHACVLNVLYNLTAEGRSRSGARFADLAFHTDVLDRDNLISLYEARMIQAHAYVGRAAINLRTASDQELLDSHHLLTSRGVWWVEDDPRNSLLRRVDASPLGRTTLARAMQHVSTVPEGIRLIGEVVRDGYASIHTAADLMEVPTRLIGRACRHHLNDYVLLPTPKIRKVLGARP